MLNNIQNSFSFKKVYKKKIKNIKFNNVKLGIVGIRTLESGRLTPKQLEAIRRIVVRLTKRAGKFWLRVFVDQPLLKKSKGSRMGKGAGNINLWVMDLKVGQIILEISAVSIKVAKKIIISAKGKLPINSEFVFKKMNFINAKS
jgi:large subunit ribosomal protein L16